jgi:hypothetical protein
MVSTLIRCSHGAVVVGCTIVMATPLVSGCSQTIAGTVRAAALGAAPAVPATLAQLLIDPARFPVGYPAVLLDPAAVDPVLRAVDGVPAGSVVTPPECAPPVPGPAPLQAVAAQGTDKEDSTTLTVVLIRAGGQLHQRRDQLTACPSFGADVGGAVSTVEVTMLAPPPVDADDTLAVDQTVTDPQGSVRRSLTLVAQIADVRVSATWMSSPGDGSEVTPDTHALDTVFSDAVLKVRRGGQP